MTIHPHKLHIYQDESEVGGRWHVSCKCGWERHQLRTYGHAIRAWMKHTELPRSDGRASWGSDKPAPF